MDFKLDPLDDEFRNEVRSFLADNWPEELRQRQFTFRSREAFALGARILGPKGWLAPGWPIELGGANLSPVRRYILEQELILSRFVSTDRIAIDLAGPVICTFGTVQQKKRYLTKILAGEEIWCQGFSEPESGSDVNSLTTSATRDGDHYVVEGRKLWTTNAHFADMMFALVRVKIGPTLQQGLTFLLIDMRDANVEIRPIITIDERHHVNEVTLNSVRVPASNVVGEVGRGWQNARFLLARERILVSQAPRTRQSLDYVKKLAASKPKGNGTLLDDPAFRRKVALAEIDLEALEFAVLRVLSATTSSPEIDGLTSVLKLRGSDLRQRVSELAVEAMGRSGLILESLLDASQPNEDETQGHGIAPQLVQEFLFNLSATIAGGTSEIQKNLIAGVALGLN